MNDSSLPAPVAKRLEGKVALITGAASGIGESAARLFVQHGAKVVIADIQDELGHSVCNEIGSDYVHCDVTSEIDVQNAVETTISKYGKLDIMFSNAGIAEAKLDISILAFEHEDYKKVFDVNLYGAFLSAKHAAKVMIPAKKGSIIFTSSFASVCYGAMLPYAYAVSKHALVGLSKNLCVELGQYGIRVNCISPFGVATPLLRKGLGGIDQKTVEEFICTSANLKEAVLKANDVAEAALYLGGDDSKYVSGLNLVIDGGYSTTNVAVREQMKEYFG
ncbi:PREDICTED: secoisolariciresinol dehydrogenase-like [Populus euphratica]|uniref:Secoisolariciresinol dehydrogenase-like n=1 Tax=Populus euphratica TaxID=75702 RepID=A0AAJ6VEU8_POPEU|nr:PREDICTED: secoisolariciresinol dehydrogenase-like [Populus euphratica]